MADIEFGSLIGGRWVSGPGTFDDRNPNVTSDLVGRAHAATSADVDAAVSAASEAQGAWASLSATRRAEVLMEAARILRSSGEEIAALETREMGKVITDTRAEVGGAISFLEYHAGDGYRSHGEIVPSTRVDVALQSMRQAIGVVGVISPWNYPVSITTKKIAPALVCGNACVVKPASHTPGVTTRLVEILAEAGVPDGVVNLIHGAGATVGGAIATHAGVKAVTFTGSSEVGLAMARDASARGIRVQAEMGGKNALVVLPDADLERAVEMTVAGAFRQEGQLCTATSRVIAHAAIHDEFLSRLIDATAAVKYGDPMDESNTAGPLVSQEQFERVMRYVAAGSADGAKLVAGGEQLPGDGRGDGCYVAPTIFADVDPAMAIAREEIFGPVLSVIAVADLNEAIAVTNATPYGLCAAIHTTSMRAANEFIGRVESGFVGVNTPTTGLELQVPAGGVKASGWGPKEHGRTAVDFFSESKAVAIRA